MIVLTSGRSLTETGPLLQWYLESEDSYWRTAYNLGLRDRTRSLRAALILVIALSGGVLGLLWWNSGNRARLSRLPRLLRFSGRRRGSEPVRLSCRPPERGIVLAASETRMETTFRPDGSLEVAAADSAAASEMRSLLWMRGVVPEAGVRAARAGPDELVDLSVGERISEGVRIVVTDLVASEGDVTVLQHPIPREAEAVRPCLGYICLLYTSPSPRD